MHNENSHYSTVDDPAFCEAHALFVALESKGMEWMSPEALLLVGEARAAFTDHDSYRPADYLESTPVNAAAGFGDLVAVLDRLVDQADVQSATRSEALAEVLRFTRTRDLIEAVMA